MLISTERSDSSLLKKLRDTTRDDHARIERRIPVFRSDFSLQDYGRLLNSFLGFYLPYEEKLLEIRTLLPAEFEIQARLKTSLLLDDVTQFPGAKRLCLQMPPLTNAIEAVGAMYVTEGSTLGGQVIFRHLRAKFGASAGAIHFFRGYGDRTGLMWTKFRNAAERFVSPESDDKVIQAAKNTFTSMNRCLEAASDEDLWN